MKSILSNHPVNLHVRKAAAGRLVSMVMLIVLHPCAGPHIMQNTQQLILKMVLTVNFHNIAEICYILCLSIQS